MIGRSVRLRPVAKSDLGGIARYLEALSGRSNLDEDRGWPLSEPVISESIGSWTGASQDAVHLAIDVAGDVVGHVEVVTRWDALSPYLNVVIGPEHQRHGYGSDAVDVVVDHLFSTTHAANVHGRGPDWDDVAPAFAAATGFSPAGVMRRTGIRAGAYHGTLVWDMVRPEWEARRAAVG